MDGMCHVCFILNISEVQSFDCGKSRINNFLFERKFQVQEELRTSRE